MKVEHLMGSIVGMLIAAGSMAVFGVFGAAIYIIYLNVGGGLAFSILAVLIAGGYAGGKHFKDLL